MTLLRELLGFKNDERAVHLDAYGMKVLFNHGIRRFTARTATREPRLCKLFGNLFSIPYCNFMVPPNRLPKNWGKDINTPFIAKVSKEPTLRAFFEVLEKHWTMPLPAPESGTFSDEDDGDSDGGSGDDGGSGEGGAAVELPKPVTTSMPTPPVAVPKPKQPTPTPALTRSTTMVMPPPPVPKQRGPLATAIENMTPEQRLEALEAVKALKYLDHDLGLNILNTFILINLVIFCL